MYDKTLLENLLQSNKITTKGASYRKAQLQGFEDNEYPKWKRARISETEAPVYRPYNNQKILFHKQEGLNVTSLMQYEGDFFEEKLDRAFGTSDKHKYLAQTFSNTGSVISVQDNVTIEHPIVIQLELNDDNPLVLDHHLIHAKKGSDVSVLLDYSDVSKDGYHNGLLNIIAEDGAKVHVVKIQNINETSTHIMSVVSVLGRDSKVKFNSIDLGKGQVVTDYSTFIEQENGESIVESIYLGDGQSKLDLGYNIYHNSRRSNSNILVKGALLDTARKVFRGNLFFKRGAKKSVGSEQEYVILLDERVKSDSIPALLCDEDDVQGEHAASAGQVDSNKLFYLMSRGLTEKESKQLIIMASFAPVIESIPIEGLKEKIAEEVGLRLTKEL